MTASCSCDVDNLNLCRLLKVLLGDRYPGAAGSGGDVSHVRTFQALRSIRAIALHCTAAQYTALQYTAAAVLREAETLLQPDPLYHCSLTTLTPALCCMQQHGGSAWAGDEAQGEGRFDAQHSGRGAAQQGLLPDPKEDANRVIEDILAVCACLAGQALIIFLGIASRVLTSTPQL